jgi:hypothetical protein
VITEELFKAFVQCPTKAFLLAQGTQPSENIYVDWARREADSYRTFHSARLAARYAVFESPDAAFSLGALSSEWRFALNVEARSQNLHSGAVIKRQGMGLNARSENGSDG